MAYSIEVVGTGPIAAEVQETTQRGQKFDPVERTELAVATLRSLGLFGDLGQVRESLGQSMQVLHDAVDPGPDESVEPLVGLTLPEGFRLDVLLDGLERRGILLFYPGTDENWARWRQLSAAQLSTRTFGEQQPHTGTTVRAQALGMQISPARDEKIESGLQLNGMSDAEHKAAIQARWAEHEAANPNTTLRSMSPADYLMLLAQRHEEPGGKQLDRLTITRFPQLSGQFLGEKPVPALDSVSDRLRALSLPAAGFVSGGVRLVEAAV